MKSRLVLLCLLLLPCLDSLAADRGLDVRDLVGLDRVSSPVLSPDGSVVVFAQRSMDQERVKASTGLWMRDLRTRDQRPPSRLTADGWNVNSPAFSPDGKAVYFLSARSGSQQLYSVPVAGGEPRQLTAFALDVGNYRVSPDGSRLAFSARTFADCRADFSCTRKRLDDSKAKQSTGIVHDRLFVRHWDAWADGRRNRLFVAPLPVTIGEPVATAVSLTHAIDGDAPSMPFGDASEYTWAPDGGSLVASIRAAGREEAWSTNFDLYRFNADGTGAAVNLTQANPAWDTGPVFSADGGTLYYRATNRPGYEADRFGLRSLDLESGALRRIADGWDRSADSITLSPDGKTLFTTAQDVGMHPLFAIDMDSDAVRKVVGEGSVSAFVIAGDTLAFTRNTLQTGDQLFTTTLAGAPLRSITPSASDYLPGVTMGAAEQFSFKGAQGATVYAYVVKPWNYVEGRKYPVAFLVHGGPQGSFGDGWSYRWNPQTYAGQGYAVVMIDFHGSTGYGQAFTDSIRDDWGGKPLEDLQKGWAAAQKQYPFLDGDKACALGASYGGYMINWMAGNWLDRSGKSPWKCAVTHNGVTDTLSMGLATEELWFTEWEFGGTVHANPQGYEKFNPARHIHKWSTPTLVVASQNDFRVPLEQSLSAFTALQRAGIESRLLYFPDENHWVLKPQNSVLWHDTVNDWLKQHIGQ